MRQHVSQSYVHPTASDFDEHERDMEELEMVEQRRGSLPVGDSELEFLDARDRDLHRRIDGWVDRFTT